jgi:hypothetical protein
MPHRFNDPRSHRRYRETRAAWLPSHMGDPCALCHQPVLGKATVEHLDPVRSIMARARDYAEAVAMCCDTSRWAIAHPRCQAQQGARVTNHRAARPRHTPSRAW